MAAISATTKSGTMYEDPRDWRCTGVASGIGSNQCGGVWTDQPAGAQELRGSGGGAYVAVCCSVRSGAGGSGCVESSGSPGLLAGTLNCGLRHGRFGWAPSRVTGTGSSLNRGG